MATADVSKPPDVVFYAVTGLTGIVMLLTLYVWLTLPTPPNNRSQITTLERTAMTAGESKAAVERQIDGVKSNIARVQGTLSAQADMLQRQDQPDNMEKLRKEYADLVAAYNLAQATAPAAPSLLTKTGGDQPTPELLEAWKQVLVQIQGADQELACGLRLNNRVYTCVLPFKPRQISYWRVRAPAEPQFSSLPCLEVLPTAKEQIGILDLPASGLGDNNSLPKGIRQTTPTTGTEVYCVCHQRADRTVLLNTLVTGVVSGTLQIDGTLVLKTTIPATPEMIGAPVFLGQGDLVGMLGGKLGDGEDLAYVIPMAAFQQLSPQPKPKP